MLFRSGCTIQNVWAISVLEQEAEVGEKKVVQTISSRIGVLKSMVLKGRCGPGEWLEQSS